MTSYWMLMAGLTAGTQLDLMLILCGNGQADGPRVGGHSDSMTGNLGSIIWILQMSNALCRLQRCRPDSSHHSYKQAMWPCSEVCQSQSATSR